MAYLVDYYCLSDAGLRRSANQDNFICAGQSDPCEPSRPSRKSCGTADTASPAVFGVFDGMGGEERGEVASYIAAAALAGHRFGILKKRALKRCMKRANSEICRYVMDHSLSSMGTTAAVLLFSGRRVHLCNIGDSRIYRFSEGALSQLSVDHVMPAGYGMKPSLLQYLGIPENEMLIAPHQLTLDCRSGDIYLICSDGLSDMVTEEAIRGVLADAPPDRAADTLMRLALDSGGRDNVTVIVIRVR